MAPQRELRSEHGQLLQPGAWTDPGPAPVRQRAEARRNGARVPGLQRGHQHLQGLPAAASDARCGSRSSSETSSTGRSSCDPNTNWSSGSFGPVNTQCNQPRSIQLGLAVRLTESTSRIQPGALPASSGPPGSNLGRAGSFQGDRPARARRPLRRSALLARAALVAAAPSWRCSRSQALQRAAALVQQGRLEEADQQARLALADPRDARPVACSVLGAIRLQTEAARGKRPASPGSDPAGARLLGAH